MSMSLQFRIFNSHQYASRQALETELNRFSAEHEIVSAREVPRDIFKDRALVKGYDVIVQYKGKEDKSFEWEKETFQHVKMGTYIVGKRTLRLNRIENEYLTKLIAEGEESFVEVEKFAQLHDVEDPSLTIRANMCRLRKKLKTVGFDVVKEGKFGYGLKKL